MIVAGIAPTSARACSYATWILLAGFSLLLLSHLESASLWYADEYRGAERARELLVTGDWWTVHENFQPNFHKPPLHYWLTASTLHLFGDGKFAMRFWTWAFTVGTLALSAVYARLLAPGSPLAAPLTLVAVALFGPFVEYVQIGLLDAGLAFWILAVLVCAERSRQDPRWLPAAGLCAGLGSLYKVPLPLAIWLVWLFLDARTTETRRVMGRSGYLWTGLAVAAALTLAWPAIQLTRHGAEWWNIYVQSEGGFLLTHPSKKENYGLATYFIWLVSKWWLFAPLTFAGIVWACWKGRSPAAGDPQAVRLYEVAVIAGVYLLVLSSLQAKSHRYELPLLPLLALLGSVFFLRQPMSVRWRAACIAIGVVPLLVGFWPHFFKRDRFDFTTRVALARRFGDPTVQARFLFTIDGIEEPGLLLFFGQLRQPVYSLPASLAVMIDGSWHGLISTCDWPELERGAPGTRKIHDDGRVVEFVRD